MKFLKASIGILSLLATNVIGQVDQKCIDRTPNLGARFTRGGNDCCTYSEVKCFITDESYYPEGYDPRFALRCNRNIRADPITTKNGTDYPKVAVRLEYKMCNWNQDPNYKILLSNTNAKFSEWHQATDTLKTISERTIYEKKWVNRVLDSEECITVVQNTVIDTSLGDHNLDALIQGNAVIDGVTIIPGQNGNEFCYAYAFERILLDKGECDVDTSVACYVMDGETVTNMKCQDKIDALCPTNQELTFDAQFQWEACNGEDRVINLSTNSNYNFNGEKEYVADLPANSCLSFVTTDTIDCLKEKSWSMYIQGESWQSGGTPFIDKECVDYSSQMLYLPLSAEPIPAPTLSPAPSESPTLSHAPSESPSVSKSPSSSSGPSNNPTESHKPTTSHSPTLSANPTESHKPSTSHAPSLSANPTASQKPTTSHAPSLSANPTASQKPTTSHAPSLSAKPTVSQAPTMKYNPSVNPSASQKPSTNPSISQKPTIKAGGNPAPSVPSKGKGAKASPVEPAAPKDPKVPIDPKKGSDPLNGGGISKVVEDSSSTTSLKTVFSISAVILAGLLVL